MTSGESASCGRRVTRRTWRSSTTTEGGFAMRKKTMKAPAVVHPGEILREEFLKPLEMSANRLAIELRVPAPRISEIVRERRAITAETALPLGGGVRRARARLLVLREAPQPPPP